MRVFRLVLLVVVLGGPCASMGAEADPFAGLGTVETDQPLQRHPPIRLLGKGAAVKVAPLSNLDDTLDLPVRKRMEFEEMPLEAVAEAIRETTGIDTLVDRRALEAAGLDQGVTLTVSVEGLSLASTLDVICEGPSLTWVIRDDAIMITTPERAATRMFIHVHDVSDLVDRDGIVTLVDHLKATIAPEMWEVHGGDGTMQPDVAQDRCVLIVSQSWRQQWQIAKLLGLLRRCRDAEQGLLRPVAWEGYWSVSPAAESARAALATRIDVDVEDMPLRHFLQVVGAEAEAWVDFDPEALADLGIDLDVTTVTYSGRRRTLAAILEHVLEEEGLAFDLISDRVLVTSAARASQRMSIAIYPLPRSSRDVDSLADMIEQVVHPEAWDTTGGPGTMIGVVGGATCLVVSQSTAMHRELYDLLQSLER